MSATPSFTTPLSGGPLPTVIRLIESSVALAPHGSPDTAFDACKYHFANPGKCMRAQLCLRASCALGQNQTNAHGFAATVESLHNASLVLDDLQDAALTRRGQPSVCAQFGADVALSLTLRLTTASFLCLSESKSNCFGQLSAAIHFAVSETALGQAQDLQETPGATVDDLKQIAALKSGPLFGLALTLPLIASGYERAVPSARKVAKLFGLGYQILDDIKDRSTDRLQKSDSNIVNAIGRLTSEDEAVGIAREDANNILDEAKSLACELPHQSGAGVVELIRYLEKAHL